MIKFIIDGIKIIPMWILILSLLTLIANIASIASIASISILIISLPPDYFTQKKRVSSIKAPVLRVFLLMLKNAFGVLALERHSGNK